MEAAIKFVTHSISYSIQALNILGADIPTEVSNAKRLVAWIEKEKKESFRARDAFNQLKHVFPTMKALQESLDVLEERGYTKELRPNAQQKKRKGRPPSPTILVRPEILKRKEKTEE